MQCGIAGLINDWHDNAGICGGCASCKTQTTNRRTRQKSRSLKVQAEEPQVEEPQQQEQTSKNNNQLMKMLKGEQDVQGAESASRKTTEQEAQPEESSMNYAFGKSISADTGDTANCCIPGEQKTST